VLRFAVLHPYRARRRLTVMVRPLRHAAGLVACRHPDPCGLRPSIPVSRSLFPVACLSAADAR